MAAARISNPFTLQAEESIMVSYQFTMNMTEEIIQKQNEKKNPDSENIAQIKVACKVDHTTT